MDGQCIYKPSPGYGFCHYVYVTGTYYSRQQSSKKLMKIKKPGVLRPSGQSSYGKPVCREAKELLEIINGVDKLTWVIIRNISP